MVVINKFTSAQITGLSNVAARVVYDSSLNVLRFNNSSSYANVIVAKDLSNNLTNINNFNTTGLVGINTTSPSKQVEINSSSGDCLRLTNNDSDGLATNFTDLLVSSGGDLTITPSGGNINISTHNGTNAGLKLNNVLVTATAEEINYLDITTKGIAQADKALVVDSARNIININYLEVSELSAVRTSTDNDKVLVCASFIATPNTTA